MIEKPYRIEHDKGNPRLNVIRFDHRTVATFPLPDDADRLCFQLNRIAALEAVCRVIIKDPTEMDASGDETDYDYGYTEGAKYTGFLIAQKLKAVLEEA